MASAPCQATFVYYETNISKCFHPFHAHICHRNKDEQTDCHYLLFSFKYIFSYCWHAQNAMVMGTQVPVGKWDSGTQVENLPIPALAACPWGWRYLWAACTPGANFPGYLHLHPGYLDPRGSEDTPARVSCPPPPLNCFQNQICLLWKYIYT